MSTSYEVNPTSPDPAHQTDSWHTHGSPDEAHAQIAHGEISGGALLAWLLLLFVGVFGAIIVLVFYFERSQQREVAVRTELDMGQSVRQQMATDMGQLRSFGWVDQAAGVVHIPIEQAMAETERFYREQQ